jgi:hypothetical protein
VIEMSGTAAQVQSALHTEIHRFEVEGTPHIANVTDQQVPRSLAGLVAGAVSLHDFRPHRLSRKSGPVRRDATGRWWPLFTINPGGSTAPFHAVGPRDFATIYDVPPLIDGRGVTIAIVGETNIDLRDAHDFRALFALPVNDPQVVLAGPDPGITSPDEEVEANLDVQWSGAVAPGARIKLVVSQSTSTTAGIDLSALYIVDNDLAPVMSESYGACEAGLGTTGVQFYKQLWEQAAAQGITVTVASGDTGSQCPGFPGLGVSGIASTPFTVTVGGTDFDYDFATANCWSATNSNPGESSALCYIPEQVWNDSVCPAQTGGGKYPCYPRSLADFTAGGGGKSAFHTKPIWQEPNTPADGARDLPDVALFAADGAHASFYVICQADADPQSASCSLDSPYQDFLAIGGTSASSPAFAGIMALVNQKTGQRQGNANYVLYQLAGTTIFFQPPFHRIMGGTNSIACAGGTADCSSQVKGAYGILVDERGFPAYPNGPLSTGVGSVDVANLLAHWPTAARTATTTTLSATPTSLVHGAQAAFSIAVNAASGTPTGDVSLLAARADGTTYAIGPFSLTSGAASITTNLLPGGGLQVTARYDGDSGFAPSSSVSVPIDVQKEASQVVAALSTVDQNGNISYGATSAAYGSYVLRTAVANAAGQFCAPPSSTPPQPQSKCPTGSVGIAEDGAPLVAGTFALNALGYTEDQTAQLLAGTHNLSLAYSGDASYSPSAGSQKIVVTQQPTSVTATGLVALQANGNASPQQMVVLQATVQSTSNGIAPGGTVKFRDGATPLVGTVTYTSADGRHCDPRTGASCASLTANLSLAATQFASRMDGQGGSGTLVRRGVAGSLAFALLCVGGLGLAGSGLKRARKTARYLAIALGFALINSSCNNAKHQPHTIVLTAQYSGDNNYAGSVSPVASVNVP